MLATNYKVCVWKANGEMDCDGMRGSIPLPEAPKLNSACQSLVPVPNCFSCQSNPRSEYINNYQLQLPYGQQPQEPPLSQSKYFQQEGGSDPANYYGSEAPYTGKARFFGSSGPGQCLYKNMSHGSYPICSQPSGPMIATSGFGRDALWVSPTYNQPPRDFNPPQNYYYQPTPYGDASGELPGMPGGQYGGNYYNDYNSIQNEFKNIRSHQRKPKKLVQTTITKNFYAPQHRQNIQSHQYGGGQPGLGLMKHPVERLPTQYSGKLKDDTQQLQMHPSQRDADLYAPRQQFGGYSNENYGSNDYSNMNGGGFLPYHQNIYAANPYNPTIPIPSPPAQCYGGTQGHAYPTVASTPIVQSEQGSIPDGMYKHWKPDLRYRENLEDLNAQSLYENMLSGYNTEPLYNQTDMNYNYAMNQEYRDQAQAVGFTPGQGLGLGGQQGGSDATYDRVSQPQFSGRYGKNPLHTPSQMHWDAQGNGVDMAGFTPLDSNPNLNLDTTLNTGNSINEAFQSSPLMSGLGQMQGGGGQFQGSENRWTPTYGQLLQTDWQQLQPKGNSPNSINSGCQPLVSATTSPMVSGSNMNPAPVQLQANSPWMYYETPYNLQKPAPKIVRWIPKVRDKLRVLTRELGAPYLIDRKTGGFAMWNESSLKKYYAGVFKRIELHDEEVPCQKPYPHNRNLYTWVRLDVPIEDLDKLQVISPNIYYDMTKKWLCISGATLKGNFSLLTLVCMYLQKKMSCYQIEKYELQKKYLWALIQKSGMYHPAAKRTYMKIIKESLKNQKNPMRRNK